MENGEVLQEFHAHYHPNEAPEDVSQFDPWNFHVLQTIGDKDGHRVAGIVKPDPPGVPFCG